ncbi:hypothetical protein [Yoonia sp. BS5-3]|uniref:Uncharacterized protein n=1 Tax=Yoonia phaeophyticola TaxID=3137369 RepID=A0ABZ2V7D8_9RHOB
MKRHVFCLMFLLGACSIPPETRMATEENGLSEEALIAPVLAAPIVMPTCTQDEAISHDGIGGTGCP